MPIKIPNNLPAANVLEGENIFVMNAARAYSQDIRPLRLLILNLMPIKEVTETQLLRLLGNTPLQVEADFIYTESYVPTHTSRAYLSEFYGTFAEVRHKKYDGFIITGAPVEQYAFEEVAYWDEVAEIMQWSKKHAFSTFHICWGAQAGLYYHYGIQKYPRKEKLSGVYCHKVLHHSVPLVRSMDDYMDCPHSRWTEVRREDIVKHPELTILAESDEAGVLLLMDETGRQIFVQGHPEYDRMTLDSEYRRDKARGMEPKIPLHYYENDDPSGRPLLSWRNMANTLYTNWLNYYVYQVTPYLLEEGEKP